MKDKVLLILFKRRMSYRTLLFWAECHHSDSFPADLSQFGKLLGQITDELLTSEYIEYTEYIDNMYGKENVKWNGYKVTSLGERYLKRQNLL